MTAFKKMITQCFKPLGCCSFNAFIFFFIPSYVIFVKTMLDFPHLRNIMILNCGEE